MSNSRSVYLLRSGPEEIADGYTMEPLFATDTLKMMVRYGGGADIARFFSDKTTGDFPLDPNLRLLNFHASSGSVNGTPIGNSVASTGVFTKVTLDRGADNTSILQFKSSSVSHPNSNMDDANTYAQVSRYNAEAGGLYVKGASESLTGLAFEATVPLSTANSESSSDGRAIIEYIASATSGGDLSDISGEENLFGVFKRNSNNTITPILLLNAEGDIFLKGASNQEVLDDYDDITLLEGLRGLVTNDPKWKRNFAKSIEYAEPILKEKGIISKDGGLNLNTRGVIFLLIDALRQLRDSVSAMKAATV